MWCKLAIITKSVYLIEIFQIVIVHQFKKYEENIVFWCFNFFFDFSYWYQNGNLFPDLVTIFIAVDKADQANGCLQVT